MTNRNNYLAQRKLASLAGLIVFALFIFLAGNVLAQNEKTVTVSNSNISIKQFKHSINTCPGALAFKMFSCNYEYLFADKHGLVGRFDYDKISESYSDDSIDADGFGFLLNYRWHKSENMESVFYGAFARYRVFKGSGISDLEEFDLTIPEFTLGLNAGKRWVWDNGFNITASLGYGISWFDTEAEPSNTSTESTLNKFKDDYQFLGPFLGELSVGYAF